MSLFGLLYDSRDYLCSIFMMLICYIQSLVFMEYYGNAFIPCRQKNQGTSVSLQIKTLHSQCTAPSRRKKSLHSELFWSAFFPDFPAFVPNTVSVFSPNTGKSRKNADQNISECGLFLRSVSDILYKKQNYCKDIQIYTIFGTYEGQLQGKHRSLSS